MKNCTKCGIQLRDDAKFCDSCGAKVLLPEESKSRACPNCGKCSETDVTFCSACGTKLPLGRGGTTAQNKVTHNPGTELQRESANTEKPVKTCPRCGRMMDKASYFCNNCLDEISNSVPDDTLSVPCLLLSVFGLILVIYAPFIGYSSRFAASLGSFLFRDMEDVVQASLLVFLVLFAVFVANIVCFGCICKKNNRGTLGSALAAVILLIAFLLITCAAKENSDAIEYFQWGFWAMLLSNFTIALIAKVSNK